MGRTRVREASQGERVAEGHVSPYNIIALAPDLETARAAMAELSRVSGIEAGKISLTGPAARVASGQQERAPADLNALEYLAQRVGAAAAAGAGIGGVVGLMLTFVLPIDGIAPVLVTVVAGMIFGGVFGGVFGGFYSLEPSSAFELTFHESSGPDTAYIGVHSQKTDDIDRAEELLRARGFTEVRRVDSHAGASARAS
jgi:hypothetical protein